jgi:hypothetical protein
MYRATKKGRSKTLSFNVRNGYRGLEVTLWSTGIPACLVGQRVISIQLVFWVRPAGKDACAPITSDLQPRAIDPKTV